MHKHFRSSEGLVKAVDGVSMSIAPGEIVAFLGPNGAGKTTAIDMMLGLTQPTSGTVKVLGGAPRKAVEEGRVAAVLQTGGLLRDLTVRETVRSIAAVQQRLGRVEAVMAETELTGLAGRKVSKCSGGEQQRLKLALSLITEPELLILDEPTTGMDVNARRAFWERMRDQATRGRTIIFATHYLEEAQDFAQRIILIGRGQLVADGPTSEIRAITNGRTVQASFDGVHTEAQLADDQRVASLSRREDVTQTEISGGRVSFVSAQSDDLARAVLDAGGTDLTITEPSLENVFVQLTSTTRQEKQS